MVSGLEIRCKKFGNFCKSSSGVEQRTHKPLVGGSNPSSGTTSINGCVCVGAFVYVLQSRSGRYYYGSTTDLNRRIGQHARGCTYTTARDVPWRLVASC